MHYIMVVYHLAVSLWVGGAALFTFILTPVLFKSESRDTAGRIVGLFFPGYFRWGMGCGLVALACLAISGGLGVSAATFILAVMIACTSFQALYVEPHAARLKREIGSFETTSKDHPLRKEFSWLHGVSAVCNLLVIAGGIALVILF